MDLEADLLRVIDFSLDLEDRLFKQERYLSMLVRLLRKKVSSYDEVE